MEAEQNEKDKISSYENEIDNYSASSDRNSKILVQTLWENPDTSLESFAGSQTITLANDNYDYFDVIFKYWSTEPDFYVARVYKGYSFALITGSGYSNKIAKRNIIRISDTSFESSVWYYGGNGVWPVETSNNACIPVKIIGYKY